MKISICSARLLKRGLTNNGLVTEGFFGQLIQHERTLTYVCIKTKPLSFSLWGFTTGARLTLQCAVLGPWFCQWGSRRNVHLLLSLPPAAMQPRSRPSHLRQLHAHPCPRGCSTRGRWKQAGGSRLSTGVCVPGDFTPPSPRSHQWAMFSCSDHHGNCTQPTAHTGTNRYPSWLR